jgi:beta-glucosidase
MISAVAQANKHVIVVLDTGGPVLMPWADNVAGIIEAWYPGQEDGNSLAAILYGDFNPSAKLPLTFPRSGDAIPTASKEQWPGVGGRSIYSEKLNVGYRWYDATNTEPLFPFGFGLSYTTFRVGHFALDQQTISSGALESGAKLQVTVDVTNTGKRAGAEVVQVYIGHPAANGEPPHRLGAFGKIELQPGETKPVTVSVDATAIRIFNTDRHGWEIPIGTYEILAGTSSRDLPLKGAITIQ